MTGSLTIAPALAAALACGVLAAAEDLHAAAELGDLARVRELLARAPHSLEARNDAGRTALHAAARHGHAAVVEFLVGQGAEVDARDNSQRTPLHLAAYFGQRDVIVFLLEQGADKQAADRHGKRAIDAATSRGHNETVNLLLALEVHQLADNIYRVTPSYSFRSSTGVSHGADGVLLVDTGEAPVAERLKEHVIALGRGLPKCIINTHAHADHTGGNAALGERAIIINQGNLAEHCAAGTLMRSAAPLRGPSGRAFEAHYSLRFNGEEVRLIPAAGAHSSSDLLVHFTSANVVHMGALLVSDSFPSVNANVERYLEILDTVVDVFPPETKYIAGHGGDFTTAELQQYRQRLLGAIAVVRKAMRAGQSVEQMRRAHVLKDWESWNAFLPHAGTDYWIGAVYAAYIVDDEKVLDAARAGDLARLTEILKSDPELVNVCDSKGRTPLHLAAYLGHTDAVRFLLAHGATPDLRDRHGRRPIDAAAVRGRRAVVSLLVSAEVVHVGGKVHRITLLHGSRPNIGASVGADGTLLVDTGEVDTAEKLRSIVLGFGKGDPKYIINTHSHAVHVGGNAALGAEATIINAPNLEQRASEGILSRGQRPLRGHDGHSFETYYTLRFNGEEVRLIRAPELHSTEDLIVHFVDSGIVQMSDLLDTESFPPCGNRVPQYLEFLDAVLAVFPLDTKFIAGHGRDYTVAEVRAYRAMLIDTVKVVRRHMRAGQTVADMQRGRVLQEWNSWNRFLPQLGTYYWIGAVYASYTDEQDDATAQ
ncbi:MAG: ankyrin repeat domain-containing protein [Planctomycetes bacterium]|nr:ankyrin repeat domain-containing protein [Planctomycetota bacterium]